MSKKIKKLMNKPSLMKEWNDTSFNDLPKRWSGAYGKDNGLTEFEEQGGTDKIKLGKLYTDKDRPPFKTIKEETSIDDKGWKNIMSMMKGFFEDMKAVSGAIKEKSIKDLYNALDDIDGRQLQVKDLVKKHIKTEEVTEGIKRWKVYIKGESKPLILTGKDERDVKQLAHAMIRNSSVKIAKVVKEGVEKSYDAIMDLEGEIHKLMKTFDREKRTMTRDRASKMEKSIKNLYQCWNRLYTDTQSR